MPATINLPENDIVDAYQSGSHTWLELAHIHGVSKRTIGRILHRHGVEAVRPSGPRATFRHDATFFDCIDTEEKAYWLGFIAADGTVNDRGRKGLSVVLAISERDVAHVEAFRCAIGATNKIERLARQKAARLSLYGRALPDALGKLGVKPRKSLVMQWPDLSESMMRHFLRGYFDGDGYVGISRPSGRRPWLQLSVIGSSPFILQWQHHMRSVGARNGSIIHPNGNTEVSVIHYSGNRQVRAIHDYLYRDAAVFLERKSCLPLIT